MNAQGPAATTTGLDVSADPPAAPPIGLFEMVLEVADLGAAERFYHDLIGLPIVERWTGDRPGVWLGLGREATLGLWPPESGGSEAILGGRGGAHVHFAIRVPRGTLAAVRARFRRRGFLWPVQSSPPPASCRRARR